jgi:glutamine cyclotransferase
VTNLLNQGPKVFGEGLTILDDEIYQLTWTEHEVYVYDLAGKLKRTMRNPREGWGLTNDGRNLISATARRHSSTPTRRPSRSRAR